MRHRKSSALKIGMVMHNPVFFLIDDRSYYHPIQQQISTQLVLNRLALGLAELLSSTTPGLAEGENPGSERPLLS